MLVEYDDLDIAKILLDLPCSLYWIDKDHKYVGCNIECCSLGGLHPEAILGRTILDFAAGQEALMPLAKTFYEAEERIMQSGIPECQVFHTYPSSSQEKIVHQLIEKIPIFNLKRTAVLGMIGAGILEREYNSQFKSTLGNLGPDQFILGNHPTLNFSWGEIFQILPCSIWWLDINQQYIGCNLEYCRTIGVYSQIELIGKTILDIGEIKNWPQGKAMNIFNLDSLLIRSPGVTYNVENIIPQGEKASIRQVIAKKTLLNEKGEVDGLLCVAINNGQFGEKSQWWING